MTANVKMNSNQLIKWLIAVGLPLFILFIPTSESFTPEARMFLVLSIMAILTIAFSLMDMLIPSILLPTFYVVFNVTNTATAFKGFATQTVWIILGAYVLTVALDECGILRRISYIIIKKLGGSYNATLYAIYIVGVVLGQLCFCGHYFLMVGFVYGICKAMNLRPCSKEGAIMMGVGGMAALNVKVFLYQTSNMSLLTEGMKTVYPDFSITPVQLLFYNCPEFIVAMAFIWLVTKIFKTKDVQFEGGKEYFNQMHREMGAMSSAEKKAAVLLAVLMIYIMFQPLHGFPLNYGFMVLPWFCFFPGINIASKNCLMKIKEFFGTFAFAGACISIGQVATALGLGALIAQLSMPILAPLGKTGLTFGVLILGAIANLLLTPAAMCSLLSPALASIYQTLGYEPMTSILTVIYSLDMIFLPHEVTAYLVLFGFGMMNMKQFVAFFGGKSLFTLLMFGIIQIPWWHLLGLF